MNKFLDKRVKAAAAGRRRPVKESNGVATAFLAECAACWNSLDEARRKLRRSLMYSYGDQWGDYVTDPDTLASITEGELIKKNGKVPLKNNMIAPILGNIDGQLRQNLMRPVCVARDQAENKVGEMMSIAIEYVHDINEMEELDADCMRMLLNGGMTAQRIEYGVNPAKERRDVWVYPVNPSRLFFNTNLEDVRMWDLTCVGELFDLPLDDVLAHFGTTPQRKQRIKEIYGNCSESVFAGSRAMQGDEARNLSFYTASHTNLCRVILGWKLESCDSYRWSDSSNGTWGYLPYNTNSKAMLDAENKRRVEEGAAKGLAEDELLLIEYEFATERYWYYRYMTPYGDVLQEGRSPYWHGEHNYVLHLFPLIQGRLGNFVEQFIDQQRAINRTATLIDFIRSTSSKGVLVVDDEAFESMSREEVIDEYVRYNGVLFVKLKPGQSIDGVVRQYNSGAAIAGDFELLNLQLRLINEISGVNSAMQGHAPKAGTPASLYAQQIQNSSLNLKGLFDGFRNFRRRRDCKVMKTIQQYYCEAHYIDIAGTHYSEESKWYNPDKVQNSEFDLTISEGYNTPAYQLLANDFLMELFRANAIDVKTMLENSTYPFATKILEAVKRNEQQLAKGASMEGVSPEMLAQLAGAAGKGLSPEALSQAISSQNGMAPQPVPATDGGESAMQPQGAALTSETQLLDAGVPPYDSMLQ
ncbi:MAG: hypothetical protein IKJ97_02010 [Bacteroidaceae bacterium]|nr:hypothetical protein [Bacteroidaceae bacterium]